MEADIFIADILCDLLDVGLLKMSVHELLCHQDVCS